MDKLKCPNCKGTNVAYAIPDWEDGKLIDHGSFECFDCLFHTGMKNTEAEIMAALTRPEAVERVTDKPMERWEFEYLLSEYASGREQLNSLREGLKSDASRARIIPEVDKRVKEIKARLLSVFTTPAPIPVERLEAGKRYRMSLPVTIYKGDLSNRMGVIIPGGSDVFLPTLIEFGAVFHAIEELKS